MVIVQSLTNSMDANLMPCIVIQFSGRVSLSTACAVLTWVPFSCYVPELSHYLISFSCYLRFQGTRTRHSRETWEQRCQFSWGQNTIFGKRHSCPEENNGNLRRTYTYTCRIQYPQTDMLCGVHGIRAWNNSPLVILLSFPIPDHPKVHSQFFYFLALQKGKLQNAATPPLINGIPAPSSRPFKCGLGLAWSSRVGNKTFVTWVSVSLLLTLVSSNSRCCQGMTGWLWIEHPDLPVLQLYTFS